MAPNASGPQFGNQVKTAGFPTHLKTQRSSWGYAREKVSSGHRETLA